MRGIIRPGLQIGVDAVSGDIVASYTHPASASPGKLLAIRGDLQMSAVAANRFAFMQWFGGLGIDVPLANVCATNVLVANDFSSVLWLSQLGELESRVLVGNIIQAVPLSETIVFADDEVRIICANSQAGDAFVVGSTFAVLLLDDYYGERL